VHRSVAADVVEAFGDLYDARFPIRRMRLVDDYRGSDDASMAANNTSAYNCRRTTSGSRWSEHSYGRAIDVNPVQCAESGAGQPSTASPQPCHRSTSTQALTRPRLRSG